MAPSCSIRIIICSPYVVYSYCLNPYIARGHLSNMKGSASRVFRHAPPDMEKALMKTTFLSYYISMYNTVNEKAGYASAPVTVDEIYDFPQDLKHEAGEPIPDIGKEDISFSFYVLKQLGLCGSV